MVRTAYGQFKDLQDAFVLDEERQGLVKRLGLPMLVSSVASVAVSLVLILAALDSTAMQSPLPTLGEHPSSPTRISSSTSTASPFLISRPATWPPVSRNLFELGRSRIICSFREPPC